jgi:hypothetical protein
MGQEEAAQVRLARLWMSLRHADAGRIAAAAVAGVVGVSAVSAETAAVGPA